MTPEVKANVLDHATVEKALLSAPFHQWLGLKLGHLDDHRIEIEAPWREELISNYRIRSTHGGILAALIDLTGLFAVLAKVAAPIATVDLRVDYHRMASPGTLIARGEILKLGSKVSSAQTSVYSEDGQLVASGRGVYLLTERD
jgi:uncharacterized protein (TIGR00369 family)